MVRVTTSKAHKHHRGIMLLRTANECSRRLQISEEEVEYRRGDYSRAEANVVAWLVAEGMTIERLSELEREDR